MDGVVASINAVAPKLAEHADAIAESRRLTPEVVAVLREAGAFRIAAPRALGGPELSPREQNEVVETLAYHDPSIGWCVMIGSDWPYYSSFLPPDATDELWGSLDAITAGQVPPNGRARPVDDGYIVNGRWSFGSGSTHADVIVGGCLVMDGDAPRVIDGRPDFIVACAPAPSWNLLDTWYTTGLAGSGSTDYTATDLFVPARHTFRLGDPSHRPQPLYRWPAMFFANMSGVALGLTRRAIDVTLEIAQTKLLLPELVLLRDTSRARTVIAHAEAELGAARAYAYEALDRLWAELVAGDMPSHTTRVAVALSRSHSFRVARDVTRQMCDLVGASSVYTSHALERLQRDAITLSQHIVAQERMYEMVGQLHLTGEAPLPII